MSATKPDYIHPETKAGEKRQRNEPPPSQASNQHRDTTNEPNPLMAVYAVALMDQERQSYVRSAGRAGVDIFEEVVAQGLAGTHLELAYGIDGSGDTKQHVPITNKGCNAKTTFYSDEVLVLRPPQMEMFTYPQYACRFDLNKSILTIRLCGFENETKTCMSLLTDCTSLTAVDIRSLRNVTTIGQNFMCGCTSLSTIDFRPLTNVTSVGRCFMVGCSSLTTIDTSPFRNVTSIHALFMNGCSSLRTIDLSPMINVTAIGRSFMTCCTSLNSIDMSSLVKVTSIGSSFLCRCTSLTDVSLPPISGVTSVGRGMFEECTSLSDTEVIKEWKERST